MYTAIILYLEAIVGIILLNLENNIINVTIFESKWIFDSS